MEVAMSGKQLELYLKGHWTYSATDKSVDVVKLLLNGKQTGCNLKKQG